MEDGIPEWLYHHYEGMLQGKWACKLDIEKVVSLWRCIFQSDRLSI